jgi:hypothetical protein
MAAEYTESILRVYTSSFSRPGVNTNSFNAFGELTAVGVNAVNGKPDRKKPAHRRIMNHFPGQPLRRR